MRWDNPLKEAGYLQNVARINRKYNMNINQRVECYAEARELLGITDMDQLYS